MVFKDRACCTKGEVTLLFSVKYKTHHIYTMCYLYNKYHVLVRKTKQTANFTILNTLPLLIQMTEWLRYSMGLIQHAWYAKVESHNPSFASTQLCTSIPMHPVSVPLLYHKFTRKKRTMTAEKCLSLTEIT